MGAKCFKPRKNEEETWEWETVGGSAHYNVADLDDPTLATPVRRCFISRLTMGSIHRW